VVRNGARKTASTFSAVGASLGATFIDFLRDTISLVSHRVREDVDMVMDRVEERVLSLQRQLLFRLAGFLLLAIGALCLVFAAFYYLTQSLGVSKALVFLVLGGVLFLGGIIFSYKR
jgi:hypothetical protein